MPLWSFGPSIASTIADLKPAKTEKPMSRSSTWFMYIHYLFLIGGKRFAEILLEEGKKEQNKQHNRHQRGFPKKGKGIRGTSQLTKNIVLSALIGF
jgi:hypothetical protein